MRGIEVRLAVPEAEKWKCAHPKVHGEHFGHDGAQGTAFCGAGNGGVWVRFGELVVGVPIEWLRGLKDSGMGVDK